MKAVVATGIPWRTPDQVVTTEEDTPLCQMIAVHAKALARIAELEAAILEYERRYWADVPTTESRQALLRDLVSTVQQ